MVLLESFFKTPCCCCEFYDTKHLEADLYKMCETHNTKLLIFTIVNYHNNIDINKKYYNSYTLIQWANIHGHSDVIKIIEKYFSDSSSD